MSDVQAQPTTPAIYLYCLSRPDCLAAVGAMAAQGANGVDERFPVVAIESGDLVAVTGNVYSEAFTEQNLQTLEWVGTRALRHEAVVEQVMAVSTVLPVKFGTIFRSVESLNDFLVRNHESIAQVLSGLRGKAEWSVKGYLVQETAEQMVCATDPAIQAQMATMSSSPGVRYMQQRQMAAKVEAALGAWLDRVTDALKEALLQQAEDATVLRCHASSMTGRTERMVFNCSFLLATQAVANFQATLEEFQLAYQKSGLVLELRGPWPPYNFCPSLSEPLA